MDELVPFGALVVIMKGAGVSSTVVVGLVVVVGGGAGLVVCFFLRHICSSEASVTTARTRAPTKNKMKLGFFIASALGIRKKWELMAHCAAGAFICQGFGMLAIKLPPVARNGLTKSDSLAKNMPGLHQSRAPAISRHITCLPNDVSNGFCYQDGGDRGDKPTRVQDRNERNSEH